MPASTKTSPSRGAPADVTVELPVTSPASQRLRIDVYCLRRSVVSALCLAAGAGVLWTQLGDELRLMLGR